MNFLSGICFLKIRPRTGVNTQVKALYISVILLTFLILGNETAAAITNTPKNLMKLRVKVLNPQVPYP